METSAAITKSTEFGSGWLDLAQGSIISGSLRAAVNQSVVARREYVQRRGIRLA
jgi:hypothetical protein